MKSRLSRHSYILQEMVPTDIPNMYAFEPECAEEAGNTMQGMQAEAYVHVAHVVRIWEWLTRLTEEEEGLMEDGRAVKERILQQEPYTILSLKFSIPVVNVSSDTAAISSRIAAFKSSNLASVQANGGRKNVKSRDRKHFSNDFHRYNIVDCSSKPSKTYFCLKREQGESGWSGRGRKGSDKAINNSTPLTIVTLCACNRRVNNSGIIHFVQCRVIAPVQSTPCTIDLPSRHH
ncbi:hypothetical protein J6590_070432 [Homalodisca vitripennis]|nr:hypothetical protein J6590_070432 [Homalodisca vitripennis]